MNNLTNIIIDLLWKRPELRDNSKLLVVAVWEHTRPSIRAMSAIQFLDLYCGKQLPSHESITRISRQLQMKYKGLRGKTWGERKLEELTVINDLKRI